VKGGSGSQDDLRQDAVMQQFFGLVNALLASDTSTSLRGLRIATYKVRDYSTASQAGL
jgi:serine-protein kinase ATM